LAQNHSPTKGKKSSLNKWINGAILLAILLIIGAIGLVTMGPGNLQNSKSASQKMTAKVMKMRISVPAQDQKKETAPAMDDHSLQDDESASIYDTFSNADNSAQTDQEPGGISKAPLKESSQTSGMAPTIESDRPSNPQRTAANRSRIEKIRYSKALPLSSNISTITDDGSETEELKMDVSEAERAGEGATTSEASAGQEQTAESAPMQEIPIEKTLSASLQNSTPAKLESQEKPLSLRPDGENRAPFTVQVGVFRNKFYADRLANLLSERQYPAFLHEISGLDQKPLYLVCFGRFKTRWETLAAVEEFKNKEGMDAVAALLKQP
jgi:hypothetical protein